MLYPDNFYHIYNHANGRENLFLEERNYYFFLKKLRLYLGPYMNVYAYCLMPNHFHLLVRIKPEEEILKLWESSETFQKLRSIERLNYVEKKISKSLSNLCSSYTQAFNKVYGRKGSLFMPNFKSNIIEDDISFCKIIHYIHANPVHHGFSKAIGDWKYASYRSLLSEKGTDLMRDYVFDIFGNRNQFLNYHKQPVDLKMKWHDS